MKNESISSIQKDKKGINIPPIVRIPILILLIGIGLIFTQIIYKDLKEIKNYDRTFNSILREKDIKKFCETTRIIDNKIKYYMLVRTEREYCLKSNIDLKDKKIYSQFLSDISLININKVFIVIFYTFKFITFLTFLFFIIFFGAGRYEKSIHMFFIFIMNVFIISLFIIAVKVLNMI